MNNELLKTLIEKYPYLIPRNPWTGKVPDSYDYSYFEGEHSLPQGWLRLYLQMCYDIYEPLKKANALNTFYFTQVKEKWGTMRCYTSGAPEEVLKIINKYEHLSKYVCSDCGKPSTYLMLGYVIPYCTKCKKKHTEGIKEKSERIRRKLTYKVERYSKGHKEVFKINTRSEWKRYLSSIHYLF